MKRYVAILTTVFLLALAAAAQSQSPPQASTPPPVTVGPGSAHGLCGPDHPDIEFTGQMVGDTIGGRRRVPASASPAQLAREYKAVLLGRITRLAYRGGRYGVNTVATLGYPLVLKAPAGAVKSGAGAVEVFFGGGVGLVGDDCVKDVPIPHLRVGTLYLIFAGYGRARFGGAVAYPIDGKTSRISPGTVGTRILIAGQPPLLLRAVEGIKAEVERERRAAAGGPGGPK